MKILIAFLMLQFLTTNLSAERFEIVHQHQKKMAWQQKNYLIKDNVKQLYMAYVIQYDDECENADDIVIFHTPIAYHYFKNLFPCHVNQEDYISIGDHCIFR